MNRLREKGYIGDPKSKVKAVALFGAGVRLSEELFNKYFSK